MTFRDQDSRLRLKVQVRGETETRLSKMCLKTVSRTETGLENYITNSATQYITCLRHRDGHRVSCRQSHENLAESQRAPSDDNKYH